MRRSTLTGVSLFSGGGIGDLAMRAVGVSLLVANELLPDRAAVLAKNYPEAKVVQGSVSEFLPALVRATRERLAGRRLDVLFATPPCQGMSKNGRGKLLNGARAGQRPKLDPRNQLILHALAFAKELRPRLIVFENVPEMENTIIEAPDGTLQSVMDVVRDELGPAYAGSWEVVEFADYGVPQRRRRLITVFSTEPQYRDALGRLGSLLPPRTHAAQPGCRQQPWVTVDQALVGVPPLDASTLERARCEEVPFHRVPLLDDAKYFWVSNTPPGRGAFDNQCVNPECLFQGNQTHGAARDRRGVNRARRDTPIRCCACGHLLPRPWVEEADGYRLMAGYTSAYRRMRGDQPASALTRNLSYACSDHKVHPTQNRVLSLHEAFILHTVSRYTFEWARADGKKLSDKTVREVIGESIPPAGLEVIFRHLVETLDATSDTQEGAAPSPATSLARRSRRSAASPRSSRAFGRRGRAASDSLQEPLPLG